MPDRRRPCARTLTAILVAGAFGLLAGRTPAHGATTGHGTPCPAARLLLEPNPLGLESIEVGPDGVAIPGVCEATTPLHHRTGLRGVSRFKVRWSGCEGFTGRVLLRGRLVDGCSTLVAKVRARGVRERLTGHRLALDRFGGLTRIATTATGRFRVEQIDGVWWFVTPEGHAFFSSGANHVDPDGDFSPPIGRRPYQEAALARWGSREGWAVGTLERLRSWGFNTIGAFSQYDLFVERFPYTRNLGFFSAAPEVPDWPRGASGGAIRDLFAPAFADGAAARAETARECAADPFCIGVFSDNELLWGPSSIQIGTYVDAYMTLPAGAPGKEELQAFFEERYAGDVSAFDAVWGLELGSFDELQALESLGSDFQCEPITRTADRRAFVARAAAHYYRTVHDAIRAVAPDVLILGTRFLSTFTSRAVLEAAGPWIDVASVNDYQFDEAARNLFRQTGGDLYEYLFLDGPFIDLATVHEATGKPVMITEYSFRTVTPGAANLYPPFFPTFDTQAERADAYEHYQRELLSRPYVVGAHWYQYFDQPATGRGDGENSLFGLVTIDDEPYPEMTARATAMNALVPARPIPAPATLVARGLGTPPLGRRTFGVAPPEGDRTGYFIFIIPGTNLATAVEGDPLALDAGPLDDDGVAPLALGADAVLGVHVVTGEIACLRLRAAGSSGALSCAGGLAHDATITRETGETAPPPTVAAFLGDPAPAGSATLEVPVEVAQVPAGSTFEACLAADDYESLGTLPLTTATSTIRKGSAQATITGEPFTCGVDGGEWRHEDGPGMLVLPLPIFDPRVPGGDLAGGVRLADRGLACR